MLMLFLYMRYATSGIIINTGILVNIANPKNMPESKTRTFFLSFTPLNCLTTTVRYLVLDLRSESKIEVKSKGNNIESNKILRRIHVMGITAKNIDAIKATFLPYILSEIL